MSKLKIWIAAFRLRTLPVALASIGLGSFLAVKYKAFSFTVFSLLILTSLLLQILSNLANEYGDSIHGADNSNRKGPKRTVQLGLISKQQIRIAITIAAIASFASGIFLLYISLQNIMLISLFVGLGLLSIAGAILYTSGKKPYGYMGLGDLAVLVFFGWLGVGGSFFLYAQTWNWDILLPASSLGLLAVAVLNVNNIRDIESDKEAGKKSIPVMIGKKNAVAYHHSLLIISLLLAISYTVLHFSSWYQFSFLIILPVLIRSMVGVRKEDPKDIDPLLKEMAISNLLFTLSFGIGLII